MSKYLQCRTCGTDLLGGGPSFGELECCCNDGYCLDCCDAKPASLRDLMAAKPKAKRRRGSV